VAKKKKELVKYSPATDDQIAGFAKEMLGEWGRQIIHGTDIRDEDLACISTGSTKLDWALGRPFVEGSINEIHGANGTGKTTLALEVAASATMLGKPVYFFDLERKLTESQIDMIPRLKRELFWRIRPDNGEDAVNKVHKCVANIPGCVIIFDSITQMLPEVEDAEGAEKQTMGTVARLAAKMVRKITGPVERNRCMVLFISHITTNMNPYASGDTTKGGKAVPDIAAQRVKLKRLSAGLIKEKSTGDIIGQMTKCKVVKNNQTIPFREVEVPIIYGKGIDRSLDLLQVARDLCVVDYTNGWYTYIEAEYLGRDDVEGKRKREADMLEIIAKNPGYRKALITQVKELL
jgi:recombination protein RecA